VTLANERARLQRTQTSTYPNAPVLDPRGLGAGNRAWLPSTELAIRILSPTRIRPSRNIPNTQYPALAPRRWTSWTCTDDDCASLSKTHRQSATPARNATMWSHPMSSTRPIPGSPVAHNPASRQTEEKPLHYDYSVAADLRLISLGRSCRTIIDHHCYSTDTGQYEIGIGGQSGIGGNTVRFKQQPRRTQHD
jgi:hypothetical protein